jgi:hypothetical protein
MQFELEILGEQFTVEFSTSITSRPYSGRGADMHQPGEPPEPGEFTVNVETLNYADQDKANPPASLEMPMWLRNLIASKIIEDDGVYREVFDNANYGPDPDAAYDAMRDDKDHGFKDNVEYLDLDF